MTNLQDQLIHQLDALIVHLNQYGEDHWAGIFIEIRNQVDLGNRQGVTALTSMRGGMGSFSDLIICQINGHQIEKHQEDFANKELIRLGELVFSTAHQLNRALN